MTKIKTALVIVLAAILVSFSYGGVCLAFADTADGAQSMEQEIVDPDISTNEGGIERLEDKFTEYLKAKYGAEYEYYYNQIIEQWGSVEGYLLSFGEKLPDKYQSGWDKFVGWLSEYASVWAPILAVALVIIIAVVGKRAFNRIIDKIVNARLTPIEQELNLQSKALISLSRGQRALLGNNEKFAVSVKELEESERSLNGE